MAAGRAFEEWLREGIARRCLGCQLLVFYEDKDQLIGAKSSARHKMRITWHLLEVTHFFISGCCSCLSK